MSCDSAEQLLLSVVLNMQNLHPSVSLLLSSAAPDFIIYCWFLSSVSRHDKNRSVLSYILLHTKITVFSLSDLQLSSFSHPYSLSGALTWFIKSSRVSTPRSKLNRFLSAKVAGLTVVAVHRWPPEEDNYKIMFCYRLTCTCSIMTLAAAGFQYILHTHTLI